MKIELTGGYVNSVFKVDDTVLKFYKNQEMVGVPNSRRLSNELKALQYFGGYIAPRIVSNSDASLTQEFIEGVDFETRARNGQDVFKQAGEILSKIHQKYPGLEKNLKIYYQNRFQKAKQLASQLLDLHDINVGFNPDWQAVECHGLTCLHRDFWLANIIGDQTGAKVIDWEFAGVGSPYEDFAVVHLWIIKEFQNSQSFWQGYGSTPCQSTVNEFLKLKCLEFLATATQDGYSKEPADGFYHNKVTVLRSL